VLAQVNKSSGSGYHHFCNVIRVKIDAFAKKPDLNQLQIN